MNFSNGIFAATICLSSLSTKAAGLSWVWIVGGGLVVWISNYHQDLQSNPLQPGMQMAIEIAKGWVYACMFAMVIMLIPSVYWSGPWEERHPQWRLLLGALGIWLFLRYRPPSLGSLQIWGSAGAIASLLAYGLVIAMSSNEAPTNRIPWMAGISLLSCTLLTFSYVLKDAAHHLRQFWLGASALVLVTVLLSGVRGSFPLLLIWPLALFAMHRTETLLWLSSWRWLLPLMILLFVLGLPLIPGEDNPMARVFHLVSETGEISAKGSAQIQMSGGIRLILYRTAFEHVFDNPLWGVGPAAGKALISQALIEGGMTDPKVILGIGHFHSDLLNPWVEFGLLGLMGYLTYLGGILFVAWRMIFLRYHPALALGMLALALVHLLTGLSNMNFAHNYYPTMIAICVGLILSCASVSGRSTPR